jgi:predicted  nucleic acid-binding Zn-ribbon protein
MIIIECFKGTQEMNTLQIELKTMQINRQARNSQFEPLQEQETQIITELEEENTRMVQTHIESATLLQEYIAFQMVEAFIDKVVQVKEKGKELVEKFYSLKKAIHGSCTT